MRNRFLLLCLVVLAGIGSADEKREETQTLRKDGIELKIGGSDGYQISVDGAPFSGVSKLFVVDPAWKERYYGYNDDRQRLDSAETTSSLPGAEGLVIPLVSSRADVIEATQTLELLPGRKLRIAVELENTSNTRGVLENRLASISEAWLMNRKWTAQLKDGSTTSGTTPRWAQGTEPRSSMILADFKKAEFELPQGPLTIEVKGDAEISLVDYRRNQWAEGQKFYWFGVLGSELQAKEKLNYEIIMTFPPKKDAAASSPLKAEVELQRNEVVYKTQPAEDRVIPTPKQITWGEGSLPAGTEVAVYVDAALIGGDKIMQEYSKRLSRVYGLTFKPASEKEALIRISPDKDGGSLASESGEAYRLSVGKDGILAVSRTADGVRNALRSLEQLIRADEGDKLGFRRCDIYDYPSLPFRGIHFFTGKDARDLQIKMISEILAPLKINNLVYQVDYVKWETQPQIHSDMLGMDKAAATAVGKCAEDQGIDVIPLVNTFGHSEWLLQRPEMRYLADDPEDPYAYDPSNPKVYEICEGIYNEAIEMFKPTIMHIGHDEVSMDGFPKKPANKAIGATQLLINDTVHYYKFLKEKGIRTMIWGDMFLAPGEAPDATLADNRKESARRRSLLPKDIMIADWHYKAAPVDEYKSLGIFNSEGFDAIACTWFAPDNIVRFAKAAEKQREQTTQSLGLIQTTWAGYSFDMESLLGSVEQYSAYVLAAEAAWTGGYADSKEVPFDFQEEFLRRWNGEYLGGSSIKGWRADISSAATVISPADLGLAESALTGIKPGQTALGSYNFQLSGKNGQLAAVQLAGAFSPPNAASGVTLPVEESAKNVYLAMATNAWVPDGSNIGTVTVILQNGSEHKIELRYGKNILSITDARQTLLAPLAWKSESPEPGQGGAAIHVLKWENPTPAESIDSIKLQSAEGSPGIILFGVSGAQ